MGRLKKLFTRKVVYSFEFEPVKRGVKKEWMFYNETCARARFDFIYDQFVQEMLNYNVERAKVLQDILRDIKLLSDIHGSKIDFSAQHKKELTNTAS